MNVYVVVTFRSYGEDPQIDAVFVSEKLAQDRLDDFLNESLAHSGFVQEKELIDV